MAKPVLGWWFAADDTLPNGDGRAVVVGETLTVPGPVVLCERGLHASRRAVDALRYAPGSILYRVRLSGEVVEDDDKMVATKRTALWRIDATRALRLFACDAAESALLSERAAGRDPDPRSWEAIRVTRLWIDGKATGADWNADWNAAWNAAGAARSAVWSAARSAARGSAAERAAWSAAWSASETMLIKRIRETRAALDAAKETKP